MDTIKAYLSEHVFHVEVVLEVAIIAVARKVVLLDYMEYSAMTILAIALGYYLEKRGRYFNIQADKQ